MHGRHKVLRKLLRRNLPAWVSAFIPWQRMKRVQNKRRPSDSPDSTIRKQAEKDAHLQTGATFCFKARKTQKAEPRAQRVNPQELFPGLETSSRNFQHCPSGFGDSFRLCFSLLWSRTVCGYCRLLVPPVHAWCIGSKQLFSLVSQTQRWNWAPGVELSDYTRGLL